MYHLEMSNGHGRVDVQQLGHKMLAGENTGCVQQRNNRVLARY
jgi:hypothetical protein